MEEFKIRRVWFRGGIRTIRNVIWAAPKTNRNWKKKDWTWESNYTIEKAKDDEDGVKNESWSFVIAIKKYIIEYAERENNHKRRWWKRVRASWFTWRRNWEIYD